MKYERYVGRYRWDIFSWELVGGEGYEQTGFTNSTIAHDNTLGEDKLKKTTITITITVIVTYH